MRVPALVRARIPEARIGFFLHIPFPSSETFRILPQRERDARGPARGGPRRVPHRCLCPALPVVGAADHGASTDVDRVLWRGREVRLGVFPMGVDAGQLAWLAGTRGWWRRCGLRRSGSERLLVGIDRLDYTKGISRRLLAYEQLLLRHPELCEHVRMVQVAVPSRTGVGAYQGLRETVDELVGRINGRFATPNWSPMRYLPAGSRLAR